MKKIISLLILLLTVHITSPIKIESFDDVNWQEALMQTIRDPHMNISDRIGWVATALTRGVDLRINSYEPVREAIARGHLDLLYVFLEAGLSPDLCIYGKKIRDYIADRSNYSASDEDYVQNVIALGTRGQMFTHYVVIPYDNGGRYHQERVLLRLLTAIAHDIPINNKWLNELILRDAVLAIQYLLDNGFITVNQKINHATVKSLLFFAIHYNAHKIVKLLTSRGAHIDVQQSRDKQREILLQFAAANLSRDPHHIVQHLLDHRYISPNSVVTHPRTNINQPIIMHCAQLNAAHCTRLLALYGAHLSPNEYPESALQAAASQNCLRALQALMESGAYGVTPQAKLPIALSRHISPSRLDIHRSSRSYNPIEAESYLANFRRTSLILSAYIKQNVISRYLPDITNCLYQSYPQHDDREHQLARLILGYSQGIPIQKYKIAKVTTVVHAPKKLAKRRYADMQAADQPAVGAARAAGAHLSASAQSEIAARSAH